MPAAPPPPAPEAPPDLGKAYDPREVEPRWYDFWEKHGVFEATDDPRDDRPVYVIPMPPPNVTGSLHLGHALQDTIQDTLIRWHRMRGYNTLWQPGVDHAGIATQVVVERQLAREGKTRHDLGREAFEKRVWEWRQDRGDRILVQKRDLGDSADWRRSKFTMDPDMSRAVVEAFVRLYDAGLMRRATRLINWCPECRTALSDLEVDNEEGSNGELFEFAYNVDAPDPGGPTEIVVATTRPETMLGDTAVAVHPDDPRYKALHGKNLIHPFAARKVPVITDAILVDPKFGTGAVKVTPAHDWNDFATGKRHHLEEINIFNLDGTVNENGGTFAGQDRKKARTAVKRALDDLGLARGSKPHILTLPRCQRSGGVVEPMISTQWFLDMQAMAVAALAAVRDEKTRILPAEWKKTYDHFLENIEPWCVSRQLWWGHQIPAWHGPNGEIRVARTRPPECTEDKGWTQDPDVLDTWFSSALWPLSTIGWPEKTPALVKFYPTNPKQTSDLVTGYDILFFWVARMMMFGLYFGGEVPFRRVLLTSIVVDETGEKMSKVKGNGVDPLDLIHGATFAEVTKKTMPDLPQAEAIAKFKKAYPSAVAMGDGFPAFGADAIRFTLATFAPTNKRVALAPKRIEGYRFFVNKIWNATRFALDKLKGSKRDGDLAPTPAGFFNRWILSRLGHAIATMNAGLAEFRIDEAANEIYRFFWTDFCDWYLELTKPVFATDGGDHAALADETKATLAHVLEMSLRLLHPLMPYVTEELWQRLQDTVRAPLASGKARVPMSVALARYPEPKDAAIDLGVDREMATLQAVISRARTIRSEHEIHPAAFLPLTLRTDVPMLEAQLARGEHAIHTLVKTAGAVTIEPVGGPRAAGTVVSVVAVDGGTVEVLVGLKGLVEADKERARVERELKKIEKDVAALDKKLGASGFVDRAPKEVVDEAKGHRAALVEARERLVAARSLVDELGA